MLYVPDKQLRHIAIIMDGNGRWAKKRGMHRTIGHHKGLETLKRLISNIAKTDLKILSVYAFSQENWRRPQREVNLLMDLFVNAVHSELDDLRRLDVVLNFIGDLEMLDAELQLMLKQAVACTTHNQGLILNVAVNYSGQWDILQACQAILKHPPSERLSRELFQKYLSLSDLPAPDLLIRTGGEQRISNYFLWQLAYTELYFTDTLWPNFSMKDLTQAVEWFLKRQRRFGRI